MKTFSVFKRKIQVFILIIGDRRSKRFKTNPTEKIQFDLSYLESI